MSASEMGSKMKPRETADLLLLKRAARLLDRGLTKSGHLAAIVPQESRGNCLPTCTPICREWVTVLIEIAERIDTIYAPAQRRLFDNEETTP